MLYQFHPAEENDFYLAAAAAAAPGQGAWGAGALGALEAAWHCMQRNAFLCGAFCAQLRCSRLWEAGAEARPRPAARPASAPPSHSSYVKRGSKMVGGGSGEKRWLAVTWVLAAMLPWQLSRRGIISIKSILSIPPQPPHRQTVTSVTRGATASTNRGASKSYQSAREFIGKSTWRLRPRGAWRGGSH